MKHYDCRARPRNHKFRRDGNFVDVLDNLNSNPM
jgi:hypothetical protein